MQSALALMGIGMALMALAIQFSRAGIGWSVFVLVLAIVSMYGAFSDRLRASPLGAIIGMVALLTGAVAWAIGIPSWLGLALVCAGVLYLGLWSAIELPRGRHAHWKFQKRGTVH